MLNDEYSEVYLQLFYDDLDSLMNHITYSLKNPETANKLYEHIFDATDKRTKRPMTFEQIHLRNRKYPYYRICVGNFIVYYVVIGQLVEYRRVIYKRMSLNDLCV